MPLIDHEFLYCAVDSFLRENGRFESTVAITAAVDAAAKCETVMDLFAVPIKQKLFLMETSLLWAFFLSLAGGRAVADGDQPFADEKAFAELPARAFGLIAGVYDIGVQEKVWDHFEDDEEGPENTDTTLAAYVK